MVAAHKRHHNGITSISISMPDEIHIEVERLAKEEERSKSNMVCILIKRGLKAKHVSE